MIDTRTISRPSVTTESPLLHRSETRVALCSRKAPVMYRARLVPFALAASLGLVCGCASLSNHPWFGGRKDCCNPCGTSGCNPCGTTGCSSCGSVGCPTCGTVGACPTCGATCSSCGSVSGDLLIGEGPVLEGAPITTTPPPGAVPQSTVPPLAQPPVGQPPRLVPQAQPTPYTPTAREWLR